MTVIVTSNAPGRVRGFLASCLLEIAPGVYTAPNITAAVRERIWAVLAEWHEEWSGATVVMTWQDPELPGGQGVRSLGHPRCEFVPTESVILAKRH